MRKRSADCRKFAKELERWLQIIENPVNRKKLARAINIMYARAKEWRDEAKRCRAMAESNRIEANLDD